MRTTRGFLGRKAVGYLRVSTREQALGLQAQRDAMGAWCRDCGVAMVATFEDEGVSGAVGLDARPGLAQAIEAVREHGADTLLVHRRDRLARSVLVAAVAESLVARAGGRIVAVEGPATNDGPEGELLRTILDAISQFERSLLRSRIKAALAVKREKGQRTGGIPYGFRLGRDGVRLEPNEDEQRVARVVLELRGDGMSYGAIAQHLHEAGERPRTGLRWHKATVRRIALSKRLRGV